MTLSFYLFIVLKIMCESIDFIFRFFVLQFWESLSGNLKYMYGENQIGVIFFCIVNKRYKVENYKKIMKKSEVYIYFIFRSK